MYFCTWGITGVYVWKRIWEDNVYVPAWGDDGGRWWKWDENYVEKYDYKKDVINIADLEPSVKKVEEANNKVNLLLQKQTSKLKCDLCDY